MCMQMCETLHVCTCTLYMQVHLTALYMYTCVHRYMDVLTYLCFLSYHGWSMFLWWGLCWWYLLVIHSNDNRTNQEYMYPYNRSSLHTCKYSVHCCTWMTYHSYEHQLLLPHWSNHLTLRETPPYLYTKYYYNIHIHTCMYMHTILYNLHEGRSRHVCMWKTHINLLNVCSSNIRVYLWRTSELSLPITFFLQPA